MLYAAVLENLANSTGLFMQQYWNFSQAEHHLMRQWLNTWQAKHGSMRQ